MSSQQAREAMRSLQDRMSASIIGQERIVERLVIGLLANGNLLIEGLPGLAKTRAVKSLARNLAVDFSRIQFTPDLLPADVTGTEVMHTGSGAPEFRFEPGPIFANIVLADEINRSPAKTHAALLETMHEYRVTVDGVSYHRHEKPGGSYETSWLAMAPITPLFTASRRPSRSKAVRSGGCT